jgi:hypothetical protein
VHPAKASAPAHRGDDAGRRVGSLPGGNCQLNSATTQAIQAARRDLRIATTKLSHFAAWHAKSGCCCPFEATPILIDEIIERLWRAASTLAMKKR